MPLELGFMEEDDIPAWAGMEDRAARDWPLARAMFHDNTTGRSRRDMVEMWVRQGFRADSTQTYLKVTDTVTGELIAGALWRIQVDESTAPMAGDAKNANHKPTGVLADMARRWADFKAEFFPTQPYANLQILVTDIKHQRRGAGGMLVQWGCDKADERGLISVLGASKAGLSLYLKHGFEVVKEREIDLRPYGVDEMDVGRSMIRQPRPRPT